MESKNGKSGGSGPPPPPAPLPQFSPLPAQQPVAGKSGKAWPIALAGVLVVAGLGLGAVFLLDPFGMKAPAPVAAAPTVTVTSTLPAPKAPAPTTPVPTAVLQQSVAPTPSEVPEVPSPSPTAQEPSTPPGPGAADKLEEQHAEDVEIFADSLMGSFAVQLASARIGTEDEKFLAKYERISNAYSVYLTTTDDFYNRREADDFFWVLFSTESFDTRAEANGWCADQGMTVDDCVAREIKYP